MIKGRGFFITITFYFFSFSFMNNNNIIKNRHKMFCFFLLNYSNFMWGFTTRIFNFFFYFIKLKKYEKHYLILETIQMTNLPTILNLHPIIYINILHIIKNYLSFPKICHIFLIIIFIIINI